MTTTTSRSSTKDAQAAAIAASLLLAACAPQYSPPLQVQMTDPGNNAFDLHGVGDHREATLMGADITVLNPAKDVDIFVAGRYSGSSSESIETVGIRFTW